MTPAIFFGHGSPMNTLEDNVYTRAWRHLGRKLPRPTAVLCVSAHWFTRGVHVTAMPKPRTIHDFGGFPPELFAVQYPAPGDPVLAKRVATLLAPATVNLDRNEWGLDHGSWSVLKHVYPSADVPVVQLSIDATQPAAWHFELASRLQPLRDEGVLLVGSGNVVHNLGLFQQGNSTRPLYWAERFNDFIRAELAAGRVDRLIAYDQLGADARLSIPTAEHYLPLLYVLAMRKLNEPVDIFTDGIEFGSISMLGATVGC